MSSPKDIRCLHCGAKPGSPCKRPSGHTIPFGGYHEGRKQMWAYLNGPEPEEGEVEAERQDQEALF